MFSEIIPAAVQLVAGFSKASLCLGLLVHLSSNTSACHFLIRSVNEMQEIHIFFSLKYLGVRQKADFGYIRQSLITQSGAVAT